MPNSNNNREKVKQILDAAQSLDTAQKRVQIRKNAQQALLYLHDTIAEKNQRYYTGDSNRGKRPTLTQNSYEVARRAVEERWRGIADEFGVHDHRPELTFDRDWETPV